MRKIKKLKRYIIRNWFWISAGLILTRYAVEYAYNQRGCWRFGGEWFVLPVILMAKYLILEIICVGIRLFREEDEDAGKIEKGYRRIPR